MYKCTVWFQLTRRPTLFPIVRQCSKQTLGTRSGSNNELVGPEPEVWRCAIPSKDAAIPWTLGNPEMSSSFLWRTTSRTLGRCAHICSVELALTLDSATFPVEASRMEVRAHHDDHSCGGTNPSVLLRAWRRNKDLLHIKQCFTPQACGPRAQDDVQVDTILQKKR